MILSSGFIIFFGMLLLAAKLKRSTSLRLLGFPMTVDITVSVLTLALHWGTFSGVMAAAFAGLLTSVFTTCARWLVGYISGGVYYPGVLNIKH
jgi:hypothetical protein